MAMPRERWQVGLVALIGTASALFLASWAVPRPSADCYAAQPDSLDDFIGWLGIAHILGAGVVLGVVVILSRHQTYELAVIGVVAGCLLLGFAQGSSGEWLRVTAGLVYAGNLLGRTGRIVVLGALGRPPAGSADEAVVLCAWALLLAGLVNYFVAILSLPGVLC